MTSPGQSRCGRRNTNGGVCALAKGHPGKHLTEARLSARGATKTRRYAGKYEEAMGWFQADAKANAAQYWYPINEQYVPGSWGCGAWVLAFLAMVFLVGILIVAYMIAVRPAGELIVTYEYRPPTVAAPPLPTAPVAVAGDTMPCPRCAETIKRAARMCRFCGFELVAEAPSPPPGPLARAPVENEGQVSPRDTGS
jgi:hypothetical protein